MAFWKQKHNQTGGFSLVEIVVAITILGIVVVPMFSSLLWSYQLNQRSDDRLQAQLAVSSAVETIMAEGYKETNDYDTRFPDVFVKLESDTEAAFQFTVTARDLSPTAGAGALLEDISVTTYARRFPEGGGSDD